MADRDRATLSTRTQLWAGSDAELRLRYDFITHIQDRELVDARAVLQTVAELLVDGAVPPLAWVTETIAAIEPPAVGCQHYWPSEAEQLLAAAFVMATVDARVTPTRQGVAAGSFTAYANAVNTVTLDFVVRASRYSLLLFGTAAGLFPDIFSPHGGQLGEGVYRSQGTARSASLSSLSAVLTVAFGCCCLLQLIAQDLRCCACKKMVGVTQRWPQLVVLAICPCSPCCGLR